VQTEKKNDFYKPKKYLIIHLAFHCTSRNFVDDLTIDLKYRNIEILYPEKHPYAGGENCNLSCIRDHLNNALFINFFRRNGAIQLHS